MRRYIITWVGSDIADDSRGSHLWKSIWGLVQSDILQCSSIVGYFGRASLQSLMHISKLEMKRSDISLRVAFTLENVNTETSDVQSRGVGETLKP
jgi:hypothetical protein